MVQVSENRLCSAVKEKQRRSNQYVITFDNLLKQGVITRGCLRLTAANDNRTGLTDLIDKFELDTLASNSLDSIPKITRRFVSNL